MAWEWPTYPLLTLLPTPITSAAVTSTYAPEIYHSAKLTDEIIAVPNFTLLKKGFDNVLSFKISKTLGGLMDTHSN